MDRSRICASVDTSRLASATVFVGGAGGASGLIQDCCRAGVGGFLLVDRDQVGPENICRQEHMPDHIGRPKTAAVEEHLRRIEPTVRVRSWTQDIRDFTDAEAARCFGDADVFVAATDSHAAQARINQFALLLNRPFVAAGLYRRGRAGEVMFWRPGLPSCYRCMFPSRYAAAARGPVDPPSDGATVMDVKFLDAITAMVVIGLLTEGADDRLGRLIGQLGDRQVLQVKLDPEWSIKGSDPVRNALGVPDSSDGYVAFCTAARRDPDPGGGCPDCQTYRSLSAGLSQPWLGGQSKRMPGSRDEPVPPIDR